MTCTVRARVAECFPGGNGRGARGDVVLRLAQDRRPNSVLTAEVIVLLSPELARDLVEELQHHLAVLHPDACLCGCREGQPVPF